MSVSTANRRHSRVETAMEFCLAAEKYPMGLWLHSLIASLEVQAFILDAVVASASVHEYCTYVTAPSASPTVEGHWIVSLRVSFSARPACGLFPGFRCCLLDHAQVNARHDGEGWKAVVVRHRGEEVKPSNEAQRAAGRDPGSLQCLCRAARSPQLARWQLQRFGYVGRPCWRQ